MSWAIRLADTASMVPADAPHGVTLPPVHVGSDRGKCKIKNLRGAVKCQGTTHLDGEIGGLGDILGDIDYRGTARPGDPTFNVVGGSDDFEGATGETRFRDLNRNGTKQMIKWDFVVP